MKPSTIYMFAVVVAADNPLLFLPQTLPQLWSDDYI